MIGLHLCFFLLLFSGEYVNYPFLLGLEIPLPFFHGPMLYLYILFLTGWSGSKKSWLLHFAPAVIIYILLLEFFFKPSQEKIYIYSHDGGSYKVFRVYLKIFIIISGMIYIGLSIQAVKNYRKKISELFSNTEKINLYWVNYLIIGMALIWIAVIIKNEILVFSFVVIFIILAAYFGITRAGILNLQSGKPEEAHEDSFGGTTVETKYQKNFAGDAVILATYEKLIHEIEHGKIFTDADLSLDQVAELLDIHPNVLSQTINHIENKNFYDFINRRRVEEFKRIALLPENQKYTILALAFESGFNSKTSFNRNFKKYEHCSPSEFLKSQRDRAQ